MKSGNPATLKVTSRPSTASSQATTVISLEGRKKLVDIEAKRKWREYQTEYEKKSTDMHQQLVRADMDLRAAKQNRLQFVMKFGNKELKDYSIDEQVQYSYLEAQEIAAGAQLTSINNQISRIQQDKSNFRERLDEEIEDEKEKLDILEEENGDQSLDAEQKEFLKKWDKKNLDHEGNVRHYTNDHHSNDSDQGTEDGGSEPANQQGTGASSNVGVAELVSALGKAFGKGRRFERKLPSFDGCPGDWLTFKSIFNSTKDQYHDDDGTANVTRLGDALKDDALKAVKHLLFNPANLPKIMKVLENRFGRAEFVLDYLVEKAKAAKSPDLKNPKTMIDFGTAVEALVVNIESYKKFDYFRDKHLLDELVSKLPLSIRYKWREYKIENDVDNVSLLEFSSWLTRQVRIAEEEVKPTFKDSNREEKVPHRKRNHGGINAAAEDDTEFKCACCGKGKHSIYKCKIFKDSSISERREIAKEKELCYSCLKSGHMASKCRKKDRCGVDGCKGKHHALLHIPADDDDNKKSPKKAAKTDVKKNSVPDEELPDDDPDSLEAKEVNTTAAADNLPVVKVHVRGPNGTKEVYALFDSGASFSMVEESVAKELGLSGDKTEIRFKVFGDIRKEKSMSVDLEVSPAQGKQHYYPVRNVSTIGKLNLAARSFDADKFRRKYPHLKQMRALSVKNAKPQMVLGINAGTLYAAREIIETAPGETPAAIRSLLGWYTVFDPADVSKHFNCLYMQQEKARELELIIKDNFALDAIGIKVAESNRTKEDKLAQQLLEETTVQVKQRWETGLLWRNRAEAVPESKKAAMKRLFSMERKMDKPDRKSDLNNYLCRKKEVVPESKLSSGGSKTSEFGLLCLSRFKEYEEKGYLKKIDNPKDDNMSDRKWYLPWFFNFTPTKKPRLIFDGASKSHGKSLNDFLLKGPDMIRPLYAVLCRFRKHQIALTGDMKDMFHQISLRKEDRPSQTILFRGMDRDREPDEYQMTVLFFGSASSPASAIFAKNRNAELFKDVYPMAYLAIIIEMYVDDLLTGAETEEEVIELRRQITEIMENGLFPLVKWCSNSKKVLKTIPEDLLLPDADKSLKEKTELPTEKTLGLYWSSASDEFRFGLSFDRVPADVRDGSRRPTKREMVSLVMTLFDPLGFLAPLKMKALIIIQHVWRSATKVDWDDEIPECLMILWKEWLQELESVKKVRIPRKLSPVSIYQAKRIELHLFSDASQEAYAAAAYFRIIFPDEIYAPFVMGKARVAPVKGFASIPRGELQGALIATRLATAIKQAYGEEFVINETVLWTDSRTVLSWIKSKDVRHKVFVNNRVSEILETTEPDQWRWISTRDNVADDGTRSNKKINFDQYRWLHNKFLLKRVLVEEVLPPLEEFDDEVIPAVCAVSVPEEPGIGASGNEACGLGTGTECLPNVENFSNWMRLLRVTVSTFVAIRIMKKTQPYHATIMDMERAKSLWIRKIQRESFPQELKALEKGGIVHRRSPIFKLSPMLKNGFIVVKSRLGHAAINDNVKFPPILPKTHRYVELMIKYYHEKCGHFGQETVNNELRQQVWILDCRSAVKKCVRECVICKIRRHTPQVPEMGILPTARVTAGNPVFHHTGIDYFGPMFVKQGRAKVKRWGVLFSCLATRAIHLELADTLDTTDMVDALVRFSNLRGPPAHVWSDNATNFKGAEREIREALQSWNSDEIRSTLLTRNVEWHYIVPASPHMGGSWERMVGLVKKILFHILKEQTPRESTLRTLFSEVMNILNSRPLTFVSPDPNDVNCITPNHLLKIPCVVGSTILMDLDSGDRYRKSWRTAQVLADAFWSRWSKDYLPWLASRSKWLQPVDSLKVGDLVIVLQDNALKNEWKKGIIQEVQQAKDGQVRSALVKVATVDPEDMKVKIHLMKRPAAKIAKLGLTSAVFQAEYGEENVSADMAN